ncbi:nucleotide pyrophosphohydrolase [Actinokineospora globicatena]|uniref:nucleotide pyrophosphohydrolase n=1 Tax=Actinokineospora globicatena TaxID=103729 RepID=UPI0020A302B0|nr:nucleotide pyrophosphohydrolase [Actinokineospora globicatena]MCP2301138.1 NTP pyrophosphatase, house-cleaning of non-canonical NTPs [Actinokineospora globicatena]GLW77226.1 nucleotide pyrophosphohydrolase [Actinokineospora globicatena]GLW84060.1 nucleotide pyrophosphohydrolase [Actinokineospora globicatena]
MTLEELSSRQRAFADARAWGPFHTPKNLVMALTGEVGELNELFQWLTPEEAAAAPDDPDARARIEDEMADVLLYLVRLADVLGVDLIAAGNAKIDRNETRFPPDVGRTALER